MGKTLAALVWCPFPEKQSARDCAKALLSDHLIACANILPEVESLFEWEGEISSATEVAVLFKTSTLNLEKVISRLGELHPYDTPAIIGWRCDEALPATLGWLEETLIKR